MTENDTKKREEHLRIIARAIDDVKKNFVERSDDLNNRALIRKMFYSLGVRAWIAHIETDDEEIQNIYRILDSLIEKHGNYIVNYNVTKKMSGVTPIDND